MNIIIPLGRKGEKFAKTIFMMQCQGIFKLCVQNFMD
jgi:hypothetical protein